VLLERRVDVIPGGAAAQNERMERAEQAKRRVPGRVRTDERVDERIVREAEAEPRIERRARARRGGLVEKDFAPGAQLASADFAFSAIAAKASGSDTARSASTLRSSPISALRQPATNWL
jgi:hypothetical protein